MDEQFQLGKTEVRQLQHRRAACNVTRLRWPPRVCAPNSYHIVFKAGHGVRKYSQTLRLNIACPTEFQTSLALIILCFLRLPFWNGLSILLLFSLLKTIPSSLFTVFLCHLKMDTLKSLKRVKTLLVIHSSLLK